MPLFIGIVKIISFGGQKCRKNLIFSISLVKIFFPGLFPRLNSSPVRRLLLLLSGEWARGWMIESEPFSESPLQKNLDTRG
jgi:hypothetical protein